MIVLAFVAVRPSGVEQFLFLASRYLVPVIISYNYKLILLKLIMRI